MQISKINNNYHSPSFQMAFTAPKSIYAMLPKKSSDIPFRFNNFVEYCDTLDGNILVTPVGNDGFLSSQKLVCQYFKDDQVKTVIMKASKFFENPNKAFREMGLSKLAKEADELYAQRIRTTNEASHDLNTSFPE